MSKIIKGTISYKGYKQYRDSCAIVSNPNSYLPKGEDELGRFPTVDADIVTRFWILLPVFLLIDLIMIPYHLICWLGAFEPK